MDFHFDVAYDTGLLKSQIYLYMHPTCTETILPFCFEEILCVTLAMWWPLLRVTEISFYIEIPRRFWNSVNVINKILPTVISETRYTDIFDRNRGWKERVPLILRGLVTRRSLLSLNSLHALRSHSELLIPYLPPSTCTKSNSLGLKLDYLLRTDFQQKFASSVG